MFVTLFAVVQAIAAGVVVFSIFKMKMAIVRHPLAPQICFGLAAMALALAALMMNRIILLIRDMKRDEPDPVNRFTSEVLIRTFVLNVPTMLLLVGFTLTAHQSLLFPAAVGILAIGFTRPNFAQYERWTKEMNNIKKP